MHYDLILSINAHILCTSNFVQNYANKLAVSVWYYHISISNLSSVFEYSFSLISCDVNIIMMQVLYPLCVQRRINPHHLLVCLR